ncbi:hypothetical protein BDN71DRAFT_854017 [Pleurotus eryngii]|uniref:Uncharacterized protein n=1 Tax=Pleurotus eryngii TaxID=5323 RepID=A0A9P6DC63_PLEER|nr:hypothetical protein BDN71DRAFT_854017 [Pleurotus eryngii]
MNHKLLQEGLSRLYKLSGVAFGLCLCVRTMSFANASDFSSHDSTFNNIAGDQYIYANHYHITRYRSTPGRPFAGQDPIPHFDDDAPIPTTSPYSDLIAIIEDIQYTLPPPGCPDVLDAPIRPSSAAVSRAPAINGVRGMHRRVP